MKRVYSIEKLQTMLKELLVEVKCPRCNNINIDTMPGAESTLIFGCTLCGDIETSELLSIPTVTTTVNAKSINITATINKTTSVV